MMPNTHSNELEFNTLFTVNFSTPGENFTNVFKSS